MFSATIDEELKSRKDAAVPETANVSRGSSFSFPWYQYSAIEEDTRLERPVRLSFFPGYYEDHHWPAGYSRAEECQSPIFNYFPRKQVAIGPDHQADIPVWRPRRFQDCHGSDGQDVSASSGRVLNDECSCDKWIGHCVMPMPDSISLDLDGPLGCCKTNCHCFDEGSIRCARQHVREAREELRSTLGHERFVELGFCDMGEVVALGWTEEEEQLFHEVVASNPASLGKNFWNVLPWAFPYRSSKELVSYYFNVFMLRKRAEQNRFDPFNVDSDNDEWQESDDGEFGATEEDEEDDSGVESPADDDAAQGNTAHLDEVDIHEEVEEDYSEQEEYGVSAGFLGNNESKFSPSSPRGPNTNDCTREDQDVHDDSCTSYEGQHNGADVSGGDVDVLEGMRDGLCEEGGHGGLPDHDVVVGHCDPKPWDIGGYFRGFDKDIDFLPTCNVIEEVFGNESWEKE